LTTLYGLGVGRELPVPSSRNGRRRQPYKTGDVRIIIIRFPVCCYFSPQGRGPGFRAGPTYFGPGPELHTQPIGYLIDWDVCPKNSPEIQTKNAVGPYALTLYQQDFRKLTIYRHFLINLT